MRIGHVGPRTLPKCKMRGTRLVRNRVSTMTAALVVTEPLKKSCVRAPSIGLSCHILPRLAVGSGSAGCCIVGVVVVAPDTGTADWLAW